MEKYQEHERRAKQRRDARAARAAERARVAAEQKAEEWRRKAEQAVGKVQGLSVFFDMYHPLSHLRTYDLRLRAAHHQAEAFVQDMAKGCFQGLAFYAQDANGERVVLSPASGLGEKPHFVLDPDVNTVLLRGVRPTVSVWDIYDAAAECPGFLTLSWTDPTGCDFLRDVRLRFASAEAAGQALQQIAGEAVLSAGAALAQPASNHAGLMLPPEMSHPDRVRKDEELAATILRQLDAVTGVPPETTRAVLDAEGTTVQKLDLSILYLRRVHHFCFYGAAWCRDAWELRQRCGPLLVRDPVAEPPVEGEWAEKHDWRLRKFASTITLERPRVLGCDDEPVATKCEELVGTLTLRIAEGRFKCGECQKLFKGPEYVRKHVRKAHAHLLEKLRQEAHADAARAAFVEESSSIGGMKLEIEVA